MIVDNRVSWQVSERPEMNDQETHPTKKVLEEEVQNRIREVAKKKAVSLDLGHLGLSELPSELFKLSWLQKLNLSNKPISPFDISTWSKIQFSRYIPEAFSADFLDNSLSTLPPEIKLLTVLRDLDIRFNQLTSLPPELGDLSQLTRLDLSANRLSELPIEIGNLIQLTKLYVEYNELVETPSQIGQLASLHILHLNNNRLKKLPEEIGQLNNLKFLDLSAN
ncbi:MAG: leucine-rich repeat domain-containing protein, partial [Chloroflexi bacterium]|nr:leucine-rich repeat domain-containing protein [Chloroflexota bacterium]